MRPGHNVHHLAGNGGVHVGGNKPLRLANHLPFHNNIAFFHQWLARRADVLSHKQIGRFGDNGGYFAFLPGEMFSIIFGMYTAKEGFQS